MDKLNLKEGDLVTVMDNVERIRQAKGVKKQHITKRLGLSPSMYSHYLSGFASPSTDDLQKIAIVLQVDVKVLLSDVKTKTLVAKLMQPVYVCPESSK